MSDTEETKLFEGWCILELFGHRKLGGYVQEQEIAGAAFLRIDVPGENGNKPATQFYSPASIFSMTPTTEEMARAVAKHYQPMPVNRWELPEPKPTVWEFVCPSCGPTNTRVCSNCDERHPCSCMDDEPANPNGSDDDDAKTDMDDL